MFKGGDKLLLVWRRICAVTLETSAQQQLKVNKLRHILECGGERVGGVERHSGKCSTNVARAEGNAGYKKNRLNDDPLIHKTTECTGHPSLMIYNTRRSS